MGFHINTFNQVAGTERWRQEVIARYSGAGEDWEAGGEAGDDSGSDGAPATVS
jgi:hypothetical protein